MSMPRDRPWWRRSLVLGLAAATIQAALALAISGARLHVGLEDTDGYFRHAAMIRRGMVPYRDFAVEYPPMALSVFLAASFASRGPAGFRVAFAVEMLLFNAVAVLLVAWWVGRRQGVAAVRWRLAWYTLFFLILSRFVVTRYDAAPMALGFAAAIAWACGRGATGGVLTSLGAMAKVFPSMVALVFMLGDLARRKVRGAVAVALTTTLGATAWIIVGGPRGASSALRYHTERGFEYGSLYSGAQMLAAKLAGAKITISRDHASFSTITAWSGAMTAWVLPIQAATLLLVCVVFARRGMGEGMRYSGAAVLAYIVTGKVFSPQYLIWLIPFMAVLEGPIAARGRRLFAAVCAMTLLAPASLGWLPRTSLWVIVPYNARNALIVWLLLLLVFGPSSGRSDDDRDIGLSARGGT